MGMNHQEKINKVMQLCLQDGVYVNDRGQKTISLWSKIKYFREVFGPEYGFDIKVMEHDDYYIAKCNLLQTETQNIVSTGHYKQFKKKNGTFIQGALSMAESFAIARALSFFGLLAEDITSKEEYENLSLPIRKETKDTHQNGSVPIAQIKKEISYAPHPTRLRSLREVKYADYFALAIKQHPSIYRDLDDAYKIKMDKLTKQGAIKNG